MRTSLHPKNRRKYISSCNVSLYQGLQVVAGREVTRGVFESDIRMCNPLFIDINKPMSPKTGREYTNRITRLNVGLNPSSNWQGITMNSRKSHP
jgi:hypothetical protein